MSLKQQLAEQNPRLAIVLASPEVSVQYDGTRITIAGPGLLIRHIDTQILGKALQQVTGEICEMEIRAVPEWIPVDFPLPPLAPEDLEQFRKLKEKLNFESVFSLDGVRLIGVLPGPKLVCRVVSPLERARLHMVKEELHELASEFYGQPVEFIYSPLAESDLHS